MRYLEFEFDEGRLQRSKDIVIVGIDVEGITLPKDHYMAFGGSSNVHYCHTKPHLDCDCPDFALGRDRLCKHLIAALRHERNELFTILSGGAEVESQRAKITLVCGPSASGKTTLVEKSAGVNDFVWDWDTVSRAVTFNADAHGHSFRTFPIVKAMFRSVLAYLTVEAEKDSSELGHAWIIWSLPDKHKRDTIVAQLHANMIMLEKSVKECVQNAQSGGRSESEIERVTRHAIEWWERYSTDAME